MDQKFDPLFVFIFMYFAFCVIVRLNKYVSCVYFLLIHYFIEHNNDAARVHNYLVILKTV